MFWVIVVYRKFYIVVYLSLYYITGDSMNKLIIDGKEIELSKETVASIMRGLVEPENMVPKSINLFTDCTGRIYIGFGGRNQYLGYCRVHDTWEVLAFNYVGGKDRFRLVKTLFGELGMGDVYLSDLDFKNRVEEYCIKISCSRGVFVVGYGDSLWGINATYKFGHDDVVYKVVYSGD